MGTWGHGHCGCIPRVRMRRPTTQNRFPNGCWIQYGHSPDRHLKRSLPHQAIPGKIAVLCTYGVPDRVCPNCLPGCSCLCLHSIKHMLGVFVLLRSRDRQCMVIPFAWASRCPQRGSGTVLDAVVTEFVAALI